MPNELRQTKSAHFPPPAARDRNWNRKPKRSRASRPKVRTGCGTCKIRHKKCDETRPSCFMCTSTGRICDGYQLGPDRRTRAFRIQRQVAGSISSLGDDSLSEVKDELDDDNNNDGDDDDDNDDDDDDGHKNNNVYDHDDHDDHDDKEPDAEADHVEDEVECEASTSDDGFLPDRGLAFRQAKSVAPRTRSSVTRQTLTVQPLSDPLSPTFLLADPSKVTLTQRERWYYEFFMHETSSQCASFLNGDYWQRILPQFTEAEPELRHATIALGALHWRFQQAALHNSDLNSDDPFPIIQCNRAIAYLKRMLADPQTRPPMETILATCVLFVFYAFLSGNLSQGARLLSDGVKLFDEWSNSTSQVDPKLYRALMGSFWRMQLHSLSCKATMNMVVEKFDDCYKLPDVTPMFDLSTAAGTLFPICRLVLDARHKPHTPEGYKVVSLLNSLKQWELQRCAALEARTDNAYLEELSVVLLMRMWNEIIYVLVAVRWYQADDQVETKYDAFLSHFQEIVNLARKLTTITKTCRLMPTFHMGPGILPPLFISFLKCRDWDVRRDVLTLFHERPCQEGFCNTIKSSKILRHVMKLETKGLAPGQFVPECQRISSTRVRLLGHAGKYHFFYRFSQDSEEHDVISYL